MPLPILKSCSFGLYRAFLPFLRQQQNNPIRHICQSGLAQSIGTGSNRIPVKILPRDLDPELEEVLEYFEVDEEGVDVPMVAELEPYLRKDIQKRPISTLNAEELMKVLRDQRAKDIVCLQPPTSSTDEKASEEGKSREEASNTSANSRPFTIVCSPFNKRHAKALDVIIRAFVKRNFHFEDQRHMPSRMDKKSPIGGWYSLDLHTATLHIIDEDLRRKYDLASLITHPEKEEEKESAMDWWTMSNNNDYKVPEELIAKRAEAEEQRAKRQRRLKGSHYDPYIKPCV